MISVLRVCGRCGAKISGDATREVCPACLLENGLGLFDDKAVAGGDSFAVASAKADDPGLPGGTPLLDRKKATGAAKILSAFGDYELLEEIGRGGQGVVYRAHQKSLNRTVALKVIGLGPWTTETHLKRFRREAEAAAKLQHPGIVPIHEVGERDGQCYFSMDFIEGGQLDEVVRHTPMSIRQSAELVAKVGRTVDYAHEHNILHRDIKPGNILLDKNGEPHLSDFGLARLLDTQSSVTRTIDVLGTPSYMAPEQAAGETTRLSKATDVYGLGAVLYQLLTGQPPFAGGTTYETIRLLLDTEPRQPRVLNPKVDRELSTICLKCLEKDPQRRYSSALALAEDLEHWLKHEPIRAKPSGVFTHACKWVRRNPSTTVLATSLLAFAIGLGVMVWNHKPAVIIPKSVAVLPFENLSDDPDNAYFAEGIQEEILTRLASIADLRVISRTSTQRYHSKPRNLAEIAKQLGVANILEGSVQKAADQVRVNVQLINVQSDSHLWADSYDRKLTDILGVESEIAKRIAESLQAKLTGDEEQALAVKPTNNPEAYDAYLRGLAFDARTYSFSSPGPFAAKAVGSYERAVHLDPNFAIAWARLSRADAFIVFIPISRDVTSAARRDAAKHALENAQKLKPNSPETLLALGYYQYRVLRDYGLAKTTFDRVSKMLPSSSEVLEALAYVSRRDGHWDQSVAYFEQALTVDPRNVELLSEAAFTYDMLRQFPAALKLYDRSLDITPNDDVIASKASIYLAQGNLPEAARLLSGINEQTPSGSMFGTKISQLEFERNYSEAVRLLQARQAQFHYDSESAKAPDKLRLALMQRLAGDTSNAKVTAERARNALELFCNRQPDSPFFVSMLSMANALLNEKDSALNGAQRAIMLLPSAKDRVFGPVFEDNLAQIQTMFGEKSPAISTLTHLLKTPYVTRITPALLRLDPIWDPLRSDPAFQKLCEERVNKSIAVLPFQNLSDEKENAYFADGIQDDILTNLSKIGDLKVISRTSVMAYRGDAARNAREIGQALGVATLLEGSVRRAGNRVRVNVQLINANNDDHIWAEDYDRDLTDVFAIQTDLAHNIAEALQAKLSPEEKSRITRPPTENGEAYLAFIQAHNFAGAFENPEKLKQSAQLYQRAIELDPNFALALARYSQLESWMVRTEAAASEYREKARTLAERALQLQPDLPEAHLALGFLYYYGEDNYEGALKEFEIAQQRLPNESEVYMALGAIQRRQGKWAESTANLEKAVSLNPKDTWPLQNLAMNYQMLRNFDVANKTIDRALRIDPQAISLWGIKAQLAISEKGDFSVGEKFQEKAKSFPLSGEDRVRMLAGRANLLLAERKYQEVLQLGASVPDDSVVEVSGSPSLKALKWFPIGIAHKALGDDAAARAAFLKAKSILVEQLKQYPDDPDLRVEFAKLLAWLGEKDAAIPEAQRAMDLRPESKDAFEGPQLTEQLAKVYAILGDKARAIELLDGLLNRPSEVTVQLLRVDPIWDPLRSDPAFQKLCEDKKP